MEGSQQTGGVKGLLRRVPVKVWVLLGLLAIGGIATAIEGPSSESSSALAVGDCLTAGAEPSTVACDDADAATRITEVFDDEYTAGTLAELSCPEGSSIVEQRSVLDEEDATAEAAACVEPLP